MPGLFGGIKIIAIAPGGAENRQLRLALQPARQLLAIAGAKHRQRFAHRTTGAIEEGREQQQRRQHDPAKRQRQRDIQHAQTQRDHHDNGQRADKRRYHAQIKVIQRVDIRHQTVQQFALAKTRQPGWRERQQAAEGVNA